MMRFLIVMVTFCAASAVQAAERKFSLFGFDDIRIDKGVDVVLTTGKGPSARAEGESRELLDRVILRKNGKQLVVSVRSRNFGGNSFQSDAPVTVYLSSHSIKRIAHRGGGLVTLDRLSGRTPQVRLGGFGTLQIGDVEADRLDVAMTGGGQITLDGEASDARIELQGASIFDGSALNVQRLTLVHRGPASSHVAVDKEADITNFGTGRIQIDGRPNCSVRSDGAADIICDPER